MLQMTYASNMTPTFLVLLVSFDRTMEEDTMGVSHVLLACYVICLLSVSVTLWCLWLSSSHTLCAQHFVKIKSNILYQTAAKRETCRLWEIISLIMRSSNSSESGFMDQPVPANPVSSTPSTLFYKAEWLVRLWKTQSLRTPSPKK